MRIAVIQGTGFQVPSEAFPLDLETAYGEVRVHHWAEGGVEWFLLARHGTDHLPPHRVSHRANVAALAACRPDWVVALNAVGSLDPAVLPGSILIPHDYLDLAARGERTFHDEAAVHVDVSEPYCPTLRAVLIAAARGRGVAAMEGGVLAVTPGPRLETPAEIRALRTMGASVVGMTGAPEAALARERGLCYAPIALVTNAAAGLAPLPPLATIAAEAARLGAVALEVARGAAGRLPARKACACGQQGGARLVPQGGQV